MTHIGVVGWSERNFVKSITFIRYLPLIDFRVHVINTPMGNEHAPVHHLVGKTEARSDAYIRTFQHLSTYTSLTVLYLTGQPAVYPDMFKILNTDADSSFFPALRDFVLEFILETADGWFFIPDEDTLDKAEEEHNPNLDHDFNGWSLYGDGSARERLVTCHFCQSKPDPSIFTPFLVAAAESASKMNQLRRFNMRINMEETGYKSVTRVFHFWMVKGRTLRSTVRHENVVHMKIMGIENIVHLPRLYWRTGNWTPGEVELSTWKSVVGPDAAVFFLNEDRWEAYDYSPRAEVYTAP
ncbi:hypothetical protein K469DRAFT_689494 [Zopfia rhizophila CBS 207.26]|uniref:Uncharacterized protein n=1 Tax=Zopfia rhizophila CBS 207.26 TaxID=1314779 RepID=A0A6A6DWU3_9PEZI|nr:hypothetical protein K469DRAFT_689494 [Zopfia rhizophila CBS 207.26]